MKKIIFISAAVIFTLWGRGGFAASVVPGEVLVKYRAGSHFAGLTGGLGKIGWAKVRVGGTERVEEVRERFKEDPDVLLVEPNTFGTLLADAGDPYLDEQWYLAAVNAPEAWDVSLGTGVTVAVIDSGVDLDHEDLADAILPGGWDFGDDDPDPNDQLGHGTQVAGVIAAIQDNDRGISGIAPAAKVLPLKVTRGGTIAFSEDTVAEAIIYAADHGARIINLSLGWIDRELHQMIVDAIDYAIRRGVLLVAGAGNERGPVWFPASLDAVIAVGSLDTSDEKDYYTPIGPELDLVAPGVDIRTTAIGDSYSVISGTSFAAPLVSGIAALMLSRYPRLTEMQLRANLTMRADDLGEEGRDDEFGYGKVNALRSLDPLVVFVFPSTLLGSSRLPLLYLLAIFSDGTHFAPHMSGVSFGADFLTPLGPPIIALPRFLLQLVVLGKNPPAGYVPFTLVAEDPGEEGYGLLSVVRFLGNP